MGNPFDKVIDTSRATVIKDAQGLIKTANDTQEIAKELPASIANAAVGAPLEAAIESTLSVVDVAMQSANTIGEINKTALKATKEVSDLISGLPKRIEDYNRKLTSGILQAGSDAFKQANADILSRFDLSRSVIPGFIYQNNGAMGSASEFAAKYLGLSIPSQIPIPIMPIGKSHRSSYLNLPAWGTLPNFRQMGLGTNFYWGLTLDNYDMMSTYNGTEVAIKSFAPPNPFQTGQTLGRMSGYNFNKAYKVNDKDKDSYYIPVQSYNLEWRKTKTSQVQIDDLNIDIPSGFQFPDSISIEIFDTDKYEWEVYLRRYYDTLTGRETAPFPYKNCCSRIGINVFYGTGALYMRQFFYCIPNIELSISGDQNKGTKTYSMTWKIYGESALSMYSYQDSGWAPNMDQPDTPEEKEKAVQPDKDTTVVEPFNDMFAALGR